MEGPRVEIFQSADENFHPKLFATRRVTSYIDANMKTSELSYSYPEELVAQKPVTDSRVLWVDNNDKWHEASLEEVKNALRPGDILILNDSGVIPCRVFTDEGLEILFIRQEEPLVWQVLFPARNYKLGAEIALPGNLQAKLIAKGLPQKLQVSEPLKDEYFDRFGELALPPYIQKARGERHNRESEENWYQTDWWKERGSCAAPTASLHFSKEDVESWQEKGVQIGWVTLHVGLGTFLPVKSENLDEHPMHSEWCFVPRTTVEMIESTKRRGGRVWALGTTATRTVESWAQGKLREAHEGWSGETDLFIRPGFEFKVVDVLMTNFHQPQSTLLALVFAFAGKEKVLRAYEWAVENKFRLFSYGDLSLWQRN
ncbi:MAG: tRNA preQ1(34) S-adenosylmethionine ribosyltransferase-isomerase QueA [Bdellovibrionales bacterium]|nr:tRNA preQ1(34) S-adenosylmethionine ribosyltransferase-isomerase QueA [Bdellovibrionales bacterium]